MDTDDMKQGRNKWLENYLRIKSRKEVLSYITTKSSENLDYYKQELIKEELLDEQEIYGCPNLIKDVGHSVEDEDYFDELPF